MLTFEQFKIIVSDYSILSPPFVSFDPIRQKMAISLHYSTHYSTYPPLFYVFASFSSFSTVVVVVVVAVDDSSFQYLVQECISVGRVLDQHIHGREITSQRHVSSPSSMNARGEANTCGHLWLDRELKASIAS